MLESYEDIRKRIPEKPKWWDCHGVPRYDEFHPTMSPNVYADEVMLYEIECQACGERFLVEENWDCHRSERLPLSTRVKQKRVHYGDPPCWNCASGATINCIDLITIQFWVRNEDTKYEWTKVPELEGINLQ